jgi:hypothetical protein
MKKHRKFWGHSVEINFDGMRPKKLEIIMQDEAIRNNVFRTILGNAEYRKTLEEKSLVVNSCDKKNLVFFSLENLDIRKVLDFINNVNQLFDADIETARRQTNNKKATEKDFQQKRIK